MATTAACGAPADGDEPMVAGANDAPALLQPATCARPPEGTDHNAIEAYDRVNAYRAMVGLPCSSFSPPIAAAAAAHCAYYVANHGSCVASAHREVSGCSKFRAERFGDRLKLASYSGNAAYETMTYVGAGARAVDLWVDSVWHRIPLLSPWVGDAGYGGAEGCDTMDFGWTAPPANQAPVVYPFDHQTKVPTEFDGRTESPTLPTPPRGWPSGYPIMVYGADLAVSSHQLLDSQMMPVPHVWMAPGDAASMGILRNEMVMYAHAPLARAATYRVVIEAQRDGQPVHLDWTFTTR
jgi:hypothetical protein